MVAGHSKVRNPGGEIVHQQLAWLKDLQAAMQQTQDPKEVTKIMVAKYPDYANDFIFAFSYMVRDARLKK